MGRSLSYKLKKLLSMINNSYHIVILTGAGVSTRAGIPDFRGPNGIWTREEEEGKKMKYIRKQERIKVITRNELVVHCRQKIKKNLSHLKIVNRRSRIRQLRDSLKKI